MTLSFDVTFNDQSHPFAMESAFTTTEAVRQIIGMDKNTNGYRLFKEDGQPLPYLTWGHEYIEEGDKLELMYEGDKLELMYEGDKR